MLYDLTYIQIGEYNFDLAPHKQPNASVEDLLLVLYCMPFSSSSASAAC